MSNTPEKSTLAEDGEPSLEVLSMPEQKYTDIVNCKQTSVPEHKEVEKLNSLPQSEHCELKISNQAMRKARMQIPENMKSLGKDRRFNFVKEDHYLYPDVMMLFELKGVLGKGSSSTVAHVVRKADRAEFAMKIMDRADKFNPILFRLEFEILTNLDHPNILQWLDCYMDNNFFYICTKLCKGGMLFHKLKEMEKFGEEEAAEIVKTIVSAIAHCHERNIVHRDLKPENIVYKTEAQKELVITDFGDAKEIVDEEDHQDFVGTAFFIAPESLRIRKGWELKKSDMWAIGVITYLLLTGRPPFYGRDNTKIMRKIIKAKVVWPKGCKISTLAKEFVLSLIKKDTTTRFSAKEALQHRWLMGGARSENLGREILRSFSDLSAASKLKKVFVELVANEMTQSENDLLKSQFNQIDVDGDGMIDTNDLKNFLHNQGGDKELAEVKASYIISHVDQNKDGLVSMEEFKNARLARKLGDNERLLRKQFNHIDKNKDGYISVAELSELFKGSMTTGVIESMINEIDSDADGKISFEEFRKAMKHGAIEAAMSGRQPITQELTLEMRENLMQEAAEDG